MQVVILVMGWFRIRRILAILILSAFSVQNVALPAHASRHSLPSLKAVQLHSNVQSSISDNDNQCELCAAFQAQMSITVDPTFSGISLVSKAASSNELVIRVESIRYRIPAARAPPVVSPICFS
jgi:hypothetical protein